jgi:hypothetical protein
VKVFGIAVFLILAGCNSRQAELRPTVRDLVTLSEGRTGRASSWDRTGGNRDCTPVEPGQEMVLAEVPGAGLIQHVYIGTTPPAGAFHRELLLRMYWDGERTPSVEVPLGDFFLTANEAYVRDVRTALVVVNPGMAGLGSHGYNAYFPMPFSSSARITIENQGARRSGQLCYQIEYETYSQPLPPDAGRFHAQWRREPVTRSSAVEASRNKVQWNGTNLDGSENYTILEAEGKGRIVGLFLNVDNMREGWYGEGDDMIFVDGEPWPPRYHGTGTEEIFGAGATPNAEYTGPYTGFHLSENRGGVNFSGKISMFRWYVHDPIRFQKSVRWTIEHGHANNYENDYSSVAYWYQLEPHKPFPPLAPAPERLPKMPDAYFKGRAELLGMQDRLRSFDRFTPEERVRLREFRRQAHRLFQEGRFDEALGKLDEHERALKKLEGGR